MRAEAARFVLRASSFDACECACGWRRLRLAAGRAPQIWVVKQQSRLWRCAPARAALFTAPGARLKGTLCRLGLRERGRARTVALIGATSNKRWSGPWGVGGWAPRAFWSSAWRRGPSSQSSSSFSRPSSCTVRANDWTPWLLLSGGAVRALPSGRSASR